MRALVARTNETKGIRIFCYQMVTIDRSLCTLCDIQVVSWISIKRRQTRGHVYSMLRTKVISVSIVHKYVGVHGNQSHPDVTYRLKHPAESLELSFQAVLFVEKPTQWQRTYVSVAAGARSGARSHGRCGNIVHRDAHIEGHSTNT